MCKSPRAPLTEKFKSAVHNANTPIYQLGLAVGLRPPTLHGWISGVNLAPIDDPRLVKLAEKLGLPSEEIFKKESHEK